MRSRKFHAVAACAVFVLLAASYGVIAATQIDLLRVAVWSAGGISCYIALSFVFGFDPHRTRLDPFAANWVHYVERWELRLGQATLSMLGCMVLGARLFDSEHFVSAVVSGTLSAWTYFSLRLYARGYSERSESTSLERTPE